jgi:hypothetical protein
MAYGKRVGVHAFCLAGLLLAQTAWAQLPAAQLTALLPPGGKAGSSLQVTLQGADLDGAFALFFSHPGITAVACTREPQPWEEGPQPVAGQFVVSIAADVPPGIYEVRAAGKYGVSNPRLFMVGQEEELMEAEPNSQPGEAQLISMGSTLNGQSAGGPDVDWYQLRLRQGERVLIECWARRLDSRLEPLLTLHDAAGAELSHGVVGQSGDPLLDFTAPREGAYLLQVRDAIYANGAEYFYRLRVARGPHIDFVLPPCGLAGTEAEVQVYGRCLPGGVPAGLSVEGIELERISMRVALPTESGMLVDGAGLLGGGAAGEDLVPLRLPGVAAGAWLGLATAPVILEQEPNDALPQAQEVSLPCELAGQFAVREDQDLVSFSARAAEVLTVEVISQRQGTMADPVLELYQVIERAGSAELRELQTADDADPGRGNFGMFEVHDDPVLRFEIPADGRYVAIVRDRYGDVRGDPRLVYRLAIRQALPDFRLTAVPRSPMVNPDPGQNPPAVYGSVLRRGGDEVVEISLIRRDGFAGPVEVWAEGLPAGVTCVPTIISADQRRGVLVLHAADDAPEGFGWLRVFGRALVQGQEVVREARPATVVQPGQQNQRVARARLANTLMVAVVAEAAPLRVRLKQQAFAMSLGGQVQIPFAIERRGDLRGPIVVTVLGLQRNVARQNVTVGPDATEGMLTLNLRGNAQAGTYRFYLVASGPLPYRRNPEAAEQAAAYRAMVERKAGELAAAAKAADERQRAAAVAWAQAEQQLTAAREAAEAAAKLSASLAEKAAEAAARLAEAEQALADDPENEELKAQTEAARVAATEAAAAAEKQAAAAKEEARSAEDAAAKKEEAAQALAAAEQAAREARRMAEEAAAARTRAQRAAQEAANAARPRNLRAAAVDGSALLEVLPAPLALGVPDESLALAPGQAVEVPLVIERCFDFAGPVEVVLEPPRGARGLAAEPLRLAPDQRHGALVLQAAPNASVGHHQVRVRARLRYNNQNLELSRPLGVDIRSE